MKGAMRGTEVRKRRRSCLPGAHLLIQDIAACERSLRVLRTHRTPEPRPIGPRAIGAAKHCMALRRKRSKGHGVCTGRMFRAQGPSGDGRHACTAHRASDNHRAVRVAPCDAFPMSVAAAHELRRRMSGCARATGRVCPGGQRRKNFADIKPTVCMKFAGRCVWRSSSARRSAGRVLWDITFDVRLRAGGWASG